MELEQATQLAWRKFLSTSAGEAGLLWWRENTPNVPRGDSHEIIFDAGVAQGYKKALDNLTFVLGAEKAKEVDFENK